MCARKSSVCLNVTQSLATIQIRSPDPKPQLHWSVVNMTVSPFCVFFSAEAWEAMYMAAAATEMGLRPGTRSSSTAFLAMKVAAIWTCLGRPRLEQKRDMKSPVVIRSTLVSRAFSMSLKHRPISFFEIRDTAQISVHGEMTITLHINKWS